MSSYHLTPLNAKLKEIRLARLNAGKPDEIVVIDTFVVSLSSLPEYKALSYTWGSLQMSQEIRVGGAKFFVTENLLCALRSIRSQSEPIILWIDLICINQQDLEEKASQVALMGDIYRQTREVLIWLGEAYEYPNAFEAQNELSTRGAWQDLLEDIKYRQKYPKSKVDPATDVVTALRFFAKDQHIHELPYFESPTTNGKPQILWGMAWLEVVFNIRNVALSPWWVRTWVVQEVYLSPVQTFLYGEHRISWSELRTAVRSMKQHFGSCCYESWLSLSSYWDIFDDLNYKVLEVDKLEQLRPARPNLQSLVPHFRTRQATDPRDKIYAFVSMSTRQQDGVVFGPDYTVQTEALYTRFAWHAIQDSGNLDYLARVDFQDSEKSSIRLPSWVPDWSVNISEDRYQNQGGEDNPYDVYRASGDSKASLKLLPGNLLKVHGVPAGRIVSTSDVFHYSDMPQGIQNYLNFADIADPLSTSAMRSSCYSRFWRTMFADVVSFYSSEKQDWSYRRTTLDDAELWDVWLREISSQGGDDPTQVFSDTMESVEKFRAAQVMIATAAEDRRLFKTASGLLGFGPRDTVVGDEIYVVLGAHVPFVLHRTKDTVLVEDQTMSTHRLRGPCFVCGLMDGEAVESHEAMDIVIV